MVSTINQLRVLFAIIPIFLSFAAIAHAQGKKPTTFAELAAYVAPDREQILLAGAKSEGKLVWYTSLAGGSYKALVEAFEAKYPGVKVEVYRAPGSELTTRMTEEAKARRNIADALETTTDTLTSLRDAKLLAPFNSPYLRNYPEQARERQQTGSSSGPSRENPTSALPTIRVRFHLPLFQKTSRDSPIPSSRAGSP